MKFHFKKYLNKTTVQSIILSILFIIIYYLLVPRYTSQVVDDFATYKSIYYKDLNNDGEPEMIEYFGYPLSTEYERATIIVKSLQNTFLGTWNHSGRHIRVSIPVFCDYDHDGVIDIFTFHRHFDSIFINGINPDSSDTFFVQSRFVDTTRWVNKTVHIKVLGIGHEDYNNDNFEDIIFHIDAGFSLQPRNTYIFDIKNDTILKSPESYAHLTFPYAQLFDLTNNGKKEIILSTHASENIKDFSLPFHDYSTYVMVLNSNLQFLNKPYEIKGSMAHIRACPIKQDKENYINIHYHNYGKRAGDSLFLFDQKGILAKVICIDSLIQKYNSPATLRYHLHLSDYKHLKEPIIGLKNGMIIKFDNKLRIKKQIYTSISPLHNAIQLELNNDTTDIEYLLSADKKIYFTDQDFNILTSPEIEVQGIQNFGRISQQDDKQHFFIQDKTNVFHIIVKLNPWFIYSWILIILVIITIWLLLLFIKGIISLFKKYQMMGILKARDTHKTQLARELHDELGSKITGLRLMLENIDKPESIKEIDAVSDHLQKTHQEIRNIIYNLAPPHLKHKSFSLTITQLITSFDSISDINFQLEFIPEKNIVEDLDDIIKMELFRIIQESLNNIIKHAKASNVIIQFMRQEHYLEVFVEDDGIGFDKDRINSGQGLISMEVRAKIIKGYLSLYSEKGKGTSIAIQVPLKFKQKKRKNGLLNPFN